MREIRWEIKATSSRSNAPENLVHRLRPKKVLFLRLCCPPTSLNFSSPIYLVSRVYCLFQCMLKPMSIVLSKRSKYYCFPPSQPRICTVCNSSRMPTSTASLYHFDNASPSPPSLHLTLQLHSRMGSWSCDDAGHGSRWRHERYAADESEVRSTVLAAPLKKDHVLVG